MEKHNMDVWSRYLKIFVIVSCYWVVSICTVFVNKALLSGQKVPLEAPLFITWFQCVVSFLICAYLSVAGGICKVFIFPKGTPWCLDTIKKVAPLSVMFTLMIATNNLSLKYVSLSFYYIGRSLTTVFNVVLCWMLLRQATSARCLGCCASIIFGFWLGVDQETLLGSFSLIGTIYGVIGSLVLALFSIYTKKTLPQVDQQVWLLTYCVNAYSVILFLPLMALNGEIQVLWNYAHFNSVYFWIQMIISGVCGLAVGHLTSLQIKVTSPLTHNISGTAKACAQTVLATQWHREAKSALWWTSNAIVLLSSALYAWFKQMEMEEHSKTTAQDDPVETYIIVAQSDAQTLSKQPVISIGQDCYPMEKYSTIQNQDTDPVDDNIITQINKEETSPSDVPTMNKQPAIPIGQDCYPVEKYSTTQNQDTGLVEDNMNTQINNEETGPSDVHTLNKQPAIPIDQDCYPVEDNIIAQINKEETSRSDVHTLNKQPAIPIDQDCYPVEDNIITQRNKEETSSSDVNALNKQPAISIDQDCYPVEDNIIAQINKEETSRSDVHTLNKQPAIPIDQDCYPVEDNIITQRNKEETSSSDVNALNKQPAISIDQDCYPVEDNIITQRNKEETSSSDVNALNKQPAISIDQDCYPVEDNIIAQINKEETSPSDVHTLNKQPAISIDQDCYLVEKHSSSSLL